MIAVRANRTVGTEWVRLAAMHPWHDSYVDDSIAGSAFPVVIEIPKGSKNKYELDKETGLLRLDRVLYSAVHYPADYGFIPRTFCDDGDPLDALVLGQEPVYPLTIVEARAIGVMRMRDEKASTTRSSRVSVRDPAFADFTDKAELPGAPAARAAPLLRGLQGARAQAGRGRGPARPEEAVMIIREALELYRRLRRGELVKACAGPRPRSGGLLLSLADAAASPSLTV